MVTTVTVVVTIVGVGVLLVLMPRFPAISSVLGTAENRLTLYRNSLYLAGDYLFTGIGLGETFGLVYSRYALLIFVPFLTYSHNLPLAVWLGQGILGLISFIGMIICLYVFSTRVILQGNAHKVIDLLFYGALMGATVTLLHGITDARQYTESPWIMPSLFLAFGLTVATGSNANKHLQHRALAETRSWIVPIGIGWAFVLLGIGITVTVGKTIHALWEVNQGALLETRSDTIIMPELDDTERENLVSQAETHYRAALAIEPGLPNANRRLGNLLIAHDVYAEGLGYLEQAVLAEPDNPAARKGLGLAYTWLGKPKDATDQFAALDDPTAMQDELFAWAQFSYESGNPLLSAYALETVITMANNPTANLDVWSLVGDRYQEAGKTIQARAWYERVLNQDPTNERAQSALDALSP